jgi:Ca-activated chloride channel family protein
MAEAGVGTSTYGLGEGFNEELMTEMARSGQGNAYYGKTADDLVDPFREELDLLSAMCARGLRLTLAPAQGVGVQVVNMYPTDGDGRVLLPDLAYASEAWALLRLTVPCGVLDSGGPGEIHLLTVGLAYSGLTGERGHAEPVHLRLRAEPAAVFGAIAADELVTRRATELAAAQLQERGREAARLGDWRRVEQLLAELRTLAAGNLWLAASVEKLEEYARRHEQESFSKETLYTSRRLQRRLTSADESAGWSEADESGKALYLRRKLEQGKRLDAPDQDTGGPSK